MQAKDQLTSAQPARAVSTAARIVITSFLICAEPAIGGERSREIRSNRGTTPVAELAPGPIAISSTSQPAHYRFEKSVARVESAGEAAGDAVAAVLKTPQIGNPQIEAAVGVVQFALAPFAAGYGAIAGHRKLTENEMSDVARNLENAFDAAARQENLRRLVFVDAGNHTHRRLLESVPDKLMRVSDGISGFLETAVEQLELAATHSNGKEYQLTITARARLRTAQNQVIAERPYRYVSGAAMLIDWARAGGLENTAQTGYRAMADEIARDFFSIQSETPLLFGEGHKASIASGMRSVSTMPEGTAATPGLQFVDYRVTGSGAFEILPGADRPEVLIRGPKSKEQFASESPTDAEWAMDGLENHRNFVVQVAACAAAIPLGLWEQTVGVVRNRSREDLSQAESMIQRITWKYPVQQQIAEALASNLSPRTSQKVTLLSLPGTENVQFAAQNPRRLSAADADLFLPGAAAGRGVTALEARVLKVELAGDRGKSHRARLLVEAEMILVRNSDGQELSVWPVRYRSALHRMADWSEANGALFRRELEQCSNQIGIGVVSRLLAEGYVAPLHAPANSIAQN